MTGILAAFEFWKFLNSFNGRDLLNTNKEQIPVRNSGSDKIND